MSARVPWRLDGCCSSLLLVRATVPQVWSLDARRARTRVGASGTRGEETVRASTSHRQYATRAEVLDRVRARVVRDEMLAE